LCPPKSDLLPSNGSCVKIIKRVIVVTDICLSIRERELEESIKTNQRELAISAIKAAPDFIEIMNNSFDENLIRIKDLDENRQKENCNFC
jgi:hypothetical protein